MKNIITHHFLSFSFVFLLWNTHPFLIHADKLQLIPQAFLTSSNQNPNSLISNNNDLGISPGNKDVTNSKGMTNSNQGYGACLAAQTCQQCSHSASSMLQTSKGQYTCVWKLTTIPNPDMKNTLHDPNEDEDEKDSESSNILIDTAHIIGNVNFKPKRKKKKKEKTTIDQLKCELIPFSNEAISKLSITCDDPINLSYSTSSKESITKTKKRKHTKKTISIVISIFVVIVFILGLFRVRAMMLGQAFLPALVINTRIWNRSRGMGRDKGQKSIRGNAAQYYYTNSNSSDANINEA